MVEYLTNEMLKQISEMSNERFDGPTLESMKHDCIQRAIGMVMIARYIDSDYQVEENVAQILEEFIEKVKEV